MTMKDDAAHEGGCLCGAVRYRVAGAARWVGHCHCQSCRRACGAPVVTWAGFAEERFKVTQGALACFASSPGVTRSFCARCGTPLTFVAERYPGEVHVTVGSLDRPGEFPPASHVWASERISWLHLADDLPRHPRFGTADE
ncbi:MAG: GFA family protein [Proteobacteria bacterium]|nr:GFA family protein [Pseudomonadota bacterium]